MNINAYINGLQHRPYRQRIRILWIASLTAAAILVTVWIMLARLAPATPAGDNELLDSLKSGVENASGGLDDLKKQIASEQGRGQLPPGTNAVALKNFSVDEIHNQLRIEFTASNPTRDIMNLLGAANENIKMVDGSATTSATSVQTTTGQQFPNKLLSGTDIDGVALFPKPSSDKVQIEFADIYFENLPDAKFSERLEIDLKSQVRGLLHILLPRQ